MEEEWEWSSDVGCVCWIDGGVLLTFECRCRSESVVVVFVSFDGWDQWSIWSSERSECLVDRCRSGWRRDRRVDPIDPKFFVRRSTDESICWNVCGWWWECDQSSVGVTLSTLWSDQRSSHFHSSSSFSPSVDLLPFVSLSHSLFYVCVCSDLDGLSASSWTISSLDVTRREQVKHRWIFFVCWMSDGWLNRWMDLMEWMKVWWMNGRNSWIFIHRFERFSLIVWWCFPWVQWRRWHCKHQHCLNWHKQTINSLVSPW